jgi:hypothetical protein
MVVKRNRRLSMLVSDEEWAMLQTLSDRDGVTASDWVRVRIRELYRANFGMTPPKKPKK